MKKNSNLKKLILGLLIIAIFFIILFLYTTFSTQLVEYGYSLQELRKQEFALLEEIDQLKAKKAVLTNLYNVEKIAVNKLRYTFPAPEQVIKVFNKMKSENRILWRTNLVKYFFVFWGMLLVGRLFQLQILNYSFYLNRIKEQTYRQINLLAKRGTIFDRNGNILAISVESKSLFLINKDHRLSFQVVQQLKKNIDIPNRNKIYERIKKGERFIWIKRLLSESEYIKVQNINFSKEEKNIINFLSEYKREYPLKKIAAHILGGVGLDERPLAGIELTQNSSLGGKGGKVEVLLDARRRIFDWKYLEKPQKGSDIYLTIDANLQYFIQKELEQFIFNENASGGAVIVLDSKNGEVLAMASYPDFSPEEISRAKDFQLKNLAVAMLYHPGSTFKIVTASAALESNICFPQQYFNLNNGALKVENLTIRDVHPYSNLSFEEIIINSSNVGAAKIGMILGKEKLFQAIKNFGFSQKTGIELPDEEKGIFSPPNRWSKVSLPFIAHGYEIAVTPLQICRMFNVIASGGLLLTPHLLKKDDLPAEKILSPGTVQRISKIMVHAVEEGTGKKAIIPGVKIAGKTGTTKIISKNKSNSGYISSFGGFFPAENPIITMFVVIDNPKKGYYGGDVAAPLFRNIAEKILLYLNIIPEINPLSEIRL